jgi:hypothetical protein
MNDESTGVMREIPFDALGNWERFDFVDPAREGRFVKLSDRTAAEVVSDVVVGGRSERAVAFSVKSSELVRVWVRREGER